MLSDDLAAWKVPKKDYTVFSDASFALPPLLRSQTGILIARFGFPLLWKSSRQKIVSQSTYQSETIAKAEALRVLNSTPVFQRELERNGKERFVLLGDNLPLYKSIQSGSENAKAASRALLLRHAILAEWRDHDHHIRDESMKADGLTKWVPAEKRALLF